MLTKEELEKFIDSYNRIEGEIKLLQEERKELFEELKNRVKPAILREAIRQATKREKFGEDVIVLDTLLEAMGHM
jgi:uncharacterized protein (UPF0335 family)